MSQQLCSPVIARASGLYEERKGTAVHKSLANVLEFDRSLSPPLDRQITLMISEAPYTILD